MLYDYECSACGVIMEQEATLFQRRRPCPVCGGKAVRVILAPPAVHFRDPGFTQWTPDVDRCRKSMIDDGTLRVPDETTKRVAKSAKPPK